MMSPASSRGCGTQGAACAALPAAASRAHVESLPNDRWQLWRAPRRRRVLVLNHEFPPVGGGASAAAYELAKAYVRRGHAVSVVTMCYAGLPECDTKDGMQIFRVRCIRRRRHVCTVPEMASFVLAARWFLASHLTRHQYHIAHTHFVVPAGAVALWAKRMFALPYVVTSHGSDVLGYNDRFRFIYPLIQRRWTEILLEAKAIASPSRFLAERIRRFKEDLPIATIPHAIAPERFSPLPKEDRILIVARLIEAKGVQDVLDALTHIDLRGWRIDIVGDGPYRKALQSRAAINRLSDRVTFHGWLDNDSDRLRELYGKARIFVSASHCENMSVAVLEAMAARCRVLASDVGGTAEVVDYSHLFEPRNIAALVHRLVIAMGADATRPLAPLGDEFGWLQVVMRYEDLCFGEGTSSPVSSAGSRVVTA